MPLTVWVNPFKRPCPGFPSKLVTCTFHTCLTHLDTSSHTRPRIPTCPHMPTPVHTRWLYFDDSRVSEVDDPGADVQSPAAYVLFYRCG